MKIKLIKWGTFPPKSPYLIKIPYNLFGPFAADLDEMDPPPMGLVPCCSPDLNYTARCMAVARDFFPDHHVYAPIANIAVPRDFLRAARAAGFRHFIIPYVEPWPHFYQKIHDLVLNHTVHVAGGDPEHEGWTWSEEELF